MTYAGEKHYKYSENKDSLLVRMNKVQGQVRGIQRMIEDERYCIDIVQQLNAVSAAIEQVSLLILQGHIEGCIIDSIREQNGENHIKELMSAVRKFMKR